MSNYLGKAKNPNTGNLEDCVFLDDFYGKRKYAVRFKDGTTYRESEVEGLPMNEHKPEPWEEEFDEEVFEMQIGTQCDPRHLDENKVKDFIRTLLATSIAQAIAEERERVAGEIERLLKGTGINAIPETTEYANGWNDCRQLAFEKKQENLRDVLASLRDPNTPTV